jgi:hypothetical protein
MCGLVGEYENGICESRWWFEDRNGDLIVGAVRKDLETFTGFLDPSDSYISN